MSKVTINTKGIDKILKNVKAEKIAAMEHFGEAVKTKARELVPVDTGFLRDSIDAGVNGQFTFNDAAGRFINKSSGRFVSNSALNGILYITAGAPYASFVEFGTRYMRAQPYMMPAIKEAFKQLPKFFASVPTGGLKSYSKYTKTDYSDTTVYLST
jgi:HK97 gp10 family phage protein